jgi:hypothetical protein
METLLRLPMVVRAVIYGGVAALICVQVTGYLLGADSRRHRAFGSMERCHQPSDGTQGARFDDNRFRSGVHIERRASWVSICAACMDSLCRRFRSLIGVDFSCSRRSRKTFGDLISKVKERAW